MEMMIAFVVFLMIFFGMALGLIFQNKPLKGSCGGVAKLMGNEDCEICGGNPNKCDSYVQEQGGSQDLAYDASSNASKNSSETVTKEF